MKTTTIPKPPRVGLVSLGCPKALVDSERIMTKLRSDGYDMSPDYAGADVVLVNTCGFLDSAKAESLEAIGEAIAAISATTGRMTLRERIETFLSRRTPNRLRRIHRRPRHQPALCQEAADAVVEEGRSSAPADPNPHP